MCQIKIPGIKNQPTLNYIVYWIISSLHVGSKSQVLKTNLPWIYIVCCLEKETGFSMDQNHSMKIFHSHKHLLYINFTNISENNIYVLKMSEALSNHFLQSRLTLAS